MPLRFALGFAIVLAAVPTAAQEVALGTGLASLEQGSQFAGSVGDGAEVTGRVAFRLSPGVGLGGHYRATWFPSLDDEEGPRSVTFVSSMAGVQVAPFRVGLVEPYGRFEMGFGMRSVRRTNGSVVRDPALAWGASGGVSVGRSAGVFGFGDVGYRVGLHGLSGTVYSGISVGAGYRF